MGPCKAAPPTMNQPEVARERNDDAQSMIRFFRILNTLDVPVFVVPGKNDAPERFFLQAAFNTEIVSPQIHTVHRSFAPLGRNYIVAGFGGEITDERRENEFFLLYPEWEAEFSLAFLRHLEQAKILLFHTPPAEKFEDENEQAGHEMVSHIIKTYAPQYAICSRSTEVVCPGQLSQAMPSLIPENAKLLMATCDRILCKEQRRYVWQPYCTLVPMAMKIRPRPLCHFSLLQGL